ncbi:DUF6279 family lipoprotein [Variovorax sp. RHLX14]|uniref:DUF6279 family lipoprotein n=1 Tax=Variovorax sp. RHLX14 TaxID=1259731 RepID=UPI003F459FD6
MRFPAFVHTTLVKMLCAILVGVALSGCSAIKLAYNNLPELGYWWLDGYVDFSGAQTPQVRDQLAQLLERHRKNELPRLLALVEKAERMAPEDVTGSQICIFSDEIRTRVLAVALDASQAGAELAATLSASQLQYLQAKYAKVNAEYADDWLDRSPDQQHKKRYDTFLDRSEDFYGTLDNGQRTLLRELVDRSIFDPRLVDAERRQRQQEFLGLLRRMGSGKAPVRELRAAIDAYSKRIAEPPPGAWKDYQHALLQESCTNIAALHKVTRPDQRERAARRLQSYAQDVRDLIAKPLAPQPATPRDPNAALR